MKPDDNLTAFEKLLHSHPVACKQTLHSILHIFELDFQRMYRGIYSSRPIQIH